MTASQFSEKAQLLEISDILFNACHFPCSTTVLTEAPLSQGFLMAVSEMNIRYNYGQWQTKEMFLTVRAVLDFLPLAHGHWCGWILCQGRFILHHGGGPALRVKSQPQRKTEETETKLERLQWGHISQRGVDYQPNSTRATLVAVQADRGASFSCCPSSAFQEHYLSSGCLRIHARHLK
jgi:hypothetical protein